MQNTQHAQSPRDLGGLDRRLASWTKTQVLMIGLVAGLTLGIVLGFPFT